METFIQTERLSFIVIVIYTVDGKLSNINTDALLYNSIYRKYDL